MYISISVKSNGDLKAQLFYRSANDCLYIAGVTSSLSYILAQYISTHNFLWDVIFATCNFFYE